MILGVSLYVGIFGHEVYSIGGGSFISKGLDTFLHFFMDLCYIYCVWIPILPVVAIYQVTYSIIGKMRKN